MKQGRPRQDGKGDDFAREHRALGTAAYMNDFDVLVGSMDFAQHTENRTFAEYEPDPYANRISIARKFATVAIFDRKAGWSCCRLDVATKYQLSVCRALSEFQPSAVRFFWIVDEPPGWSMLELDTLTGERGEVYRLPEDGTVWRVIWDELGLTETRQALRQWLARNYDR